MLGSTGTRNRKSPEGSIGARLHSNQFSALRRWSSSRLVPYPYVHVLFCIVGRLLLTTTLLVGRINPGNRVRRKASAFRVLGAMVGDSGTLMKKRLTIRQVSTVGSRYNCVHTCRPDLQNENNQTVIHTTQHSRTPAVCKCISSQQFSVPFVSFLLSPGGCRAKSVKIIGSRRAGGKSKISQRLNQARQSQGYPKCLTRPHRGHRHAHFEALGRSIGSVSGRQGLCPDFQSFCARPLLGLCFASGGWGRWRKRQI